MRRAERGVFCRCGRPNCPYLVADETPRQRPPWRLPRGAQEKAYRIHPRLVGFAKVQLAKRGLDRSEAAGLVHEAWARWCGRRPRGLYRVEEFLRQTIKDQAVELWRRERGDERHGPVDVLDRRRMEPYDTTEPWTPAAAHRAAPKLAYEESGEVCRSGVTNVPRACHLEYEMGRYPAGPWLCSRGAKSLEGVV